MRPTSPAVVLYDGACGMCIEAAEKGRKYQRPGALEWVDNGTARGKALLAEHRLEEVAEDSLIVLEDGRIWTESGAAVRTALRLRWPWRAYAAMWVVPRPLRDWQYRRIAARRIRACAAPGAQR